MQTLNQQVNWEAYLSNGFVDTSDDAPHNSSPTQIDDLKKPYESYCSKYCCGFDAWEPVQSNARLGPILVQFSSTNPAPSNAGVWTLDALFLLPKLRLKYYLKLYNRLLKNTDNRLLVSAVETLNDLLTWRAIWDATHQGGASRPQRQPVRVLEAVR